MELLEAYQVQIERDINNSFRSLPIAGTVPAHAGGTGINDVNWGKSTPCVNIRYSDISTLCIAAVNQQLVRFENL
jgi:hypothetical protein